MNTSDIRKYIEIVEYRGVVTPMAQVHDDPEPKHWVDKISSEMKTNPIFSVEYVESKIAELIKNKWFIFSTLAKEQFSAVGVEINTVRVDFYDLVSGYQNDYFGFDTQDLYYKNLRHVHVKPSDEENLKKWLDTYKYNRTSDNLLFYTSNQKGDYLIISFISPKGHDVFKNRGLMFNMNIIAESFITENIVL